jgi:predicted transcriptional regulator
MLRDIMHMIDAITNAENELARLGYSRRRLCQDAGVAPSTWTRWKAGLTEPNMRTWRRVEQALEDLRTQHESAA